MEINPYASEIRTILKNTSKSVELLNFEEEEDKYILHFSINNNPVKLTTDFNIYCYFESEILDMTQLNLDLCIKNEKTPELILKYINTINYNKPIINDIQDYYHIYQKISNISKFPIDFDVLEKESKNFRETYQSVDMSKIPKELLFNTNQIFKIIKNEIISINENITYKHYIEPIMNNPYDLSLKLKLNNPIMKTIHEKFGYDYIELKINFDPKMYPFYPPKFEFIKPSIKLPLVYNLKNLNILKNENWNSTIRLDFIINNLSEKLDKIIHDYVILEESKFIRLEFLLTKLASITKENITTVDFLNFEINKMNIEDEKKENSKFWKSGIGYGHDATKIWDISKYIKEQEIQNNEIKNLIEKINKEINSESINIIFDSIFPTYIINKISDLNLLELNKSKPLYNEIFKSLDIISKVGGAPLPVFINKVTLAINNIADEITSLFTSSTETQDDETLLQIHCISDWYKSKYIKSNYEEETKFKVVDLDSKKNYEETMKKHQFSTFEIDKTHRFYENINKKLDTKATMRMISEVSSFKHGLPLNWDSSIWVRVSKKYLNVFTFFISGPKDTPYENGIFEFHATFPSNYPEGPPQVLIHTTGNNSIRFNPNLYKCGKVCLSLLGTWAGQEGEKWNPKNSTFLQVLVSIQSLILVDNPYFNEPGYEKTMNTTKGKIESDKYNEPLHVGTIKYAINDMIKNPPPSMVEVIKSHFGSKKDEIIEQTGKWLNQCVSKENKKELEEVRNEMIELFKNLT